MPIGEWVLREACNEAARWPKPIKVAVNLSAVQLKNRQLAQTVVLALANSGLPANRLELEITESVFLQDNETTLAILHEIRGLGVRIAMDDFGTGYSSLSYLRSFPFDKIKIDRSLRARPRRPASTARRSCIRSRPSANGSAWSPPPRASKPSRSSSSCA